MNALITERRISQFVLAVLAVAAGLSLGALPVSAANCACFCKYPDDAGVKTCAGETFHIGDSAPDNQGSCTSAAAQTNCSDKCGLEGNAWLAQGAFIDYSAATLCDFSVQGNGSIKGSANCMAPINPGGSCSQNLKSCYCKYPDSFTTATCRGKTVHLKETAAADKCPQYCATASWDANGPALSNYDDACDYQPSGQDCKPNPDSKSSVCSSEVNQATTAKNAAIASTKIGSPVSLPLPLSDIKPTTLIARIVSGLLGVLGGISLLMFVIGGLIWMTAAGNADRIKKGRDTVVWAALGLTAIFGAYAILNLVIKTFTG